MLSKINKELFSILQFVIPTEKYSLCLVNPLKKDVQDLYITYSGHAIEDTIYYLFEPVHLQTEILFSESYAILEEYNAWDLDSTFYYEILYVSDEGIFLQKFYREDLKNVTKIQSHTLFQSPIWQVEETSCEYIDVEDIIEIVSRDLFSTKVPKKNSLYQRLLMKSELFKSFFEDLYEEMVSYYVGDKRNSEEKSEFAKFLQSSYGIPIDQYEGANIIISNCAAIMRKLKLSKYEMGQYFMKYMV